MVRLGEMRFVLTDDKDIEGVDCSFTLCGESKEAVSDIVTFRKSDNSEMYAMIESMSKNENLAEKIIAYYKKLMEKE